MCGRLACTLCSDDIVKNCRYKNKQNDIEEPKWVDSQYQYKPIYNGPPSTVIPVLLNKDNFPDSDNCTDYCLIAMRWGMLPTYKTNNLGNFHTHNARLENVINSSLYKPSLMTGKRCVVLVEGYYEWQTTQGENNKQPYYIYQMPLEDDYNEKYLMRLAGLFNIIRDETGVKHTCTVLTTISDSSLSWMHHRMPVILNTNEDLHNWLSYKEVSYMVALKNLPEYSKIDEKYMLKYYAVNKIVNNTSCNEPRCMQRMTVKRKSSTLDGWLKKSTK